MLSEKLKEKRRKSEAEYILLFKKILEEAGSEIDISKDDRQKLEQTRKRLRIVVTRARQLEKAILKPDISTPEEEIAEETIAETILQMSEEEKEILKEEFSKEYLDFLLTRQCMGEMPDELKKQSELLEKIYGILKQQDLRLQLQQELTDIIEKNKKEYADFLMPILLEYYILDEHLQNKVREKQIELYLSEDEIDKVEKDIIKNILEIREKSEKKYKNEVKALLRRKKQLNPIDEELLRQQAIKLYISLEKADQIREELVAKYVIDKSNPIRFIIIPLIIIILIGLTYIFYPKPVFLITIETTPKNAKIILEDEVLGISPLKNYVIQDKELLNILRAEKEDYKFALPEIEQIDKKHYKVMLIGTPKQLFNLTIETNPKNAEIFFRASSIGKSPQILAVVNLKEIRFLSVKKEGYTFSRPTEAKEQADTTYYVLIEGEKDKQIIIDTEEACGSFMVINHPDGEAGVTNVCFYVDINQDGKATYLQLKHQEGNPTNAFIQAVRNKIYRCKFSDYKGYSITICVTAE